MGRLSLGFFIGYAEQLLGYAIDENVAPFGIFDVNLRRTVVYDGAEAFLALPQDFLVFFYLTNIFK